MEAIPDKFCDVCGEPAIVAARDVMETAPVMDKDGRWWMDWKPDGDWKYGCIRHTPRSKTTYLSTEERDRLMKEKLEA